MSWLCLRAMLLLSKTNRLDAAPNRSGARSSAALKQLRGAGFAQAKHLQGGIVAWARQLEPDMVMY